MTRRFSLMVLMCFLPFGAAAEWRIGPGSEIFIGTDSAFGVTAKGGGLGVMCREGQPFLWTQGWAPARGGAERAEAFSVIVDGRGFAINGMHVPPDGLWFGTPPPGLIDALKAGLQAVVAAPSQPQESVSLRGSSRALRSVLSGCGGGTATAEAPATESESGAFDALIASACGGGYTLAEGAAFEGLLDTDATPDTVLDWGGVSCDDRSKGRGAGFCGAALCTIEVIFGQSGQRQQLLGVKPALVDRAFGLSALQTTTQGATCGGAAQVCDVIWTWNGTKLEAQK